MFSSLGFTISSLLFIIFIIILYFLKKKKNSIENPVFVFMLFLTFFIIILEFISVYTIKYHEIIPVINFIITRLYILGIIIWTTSFVVYIWTRENVNTDKNEFKKLCEKYKYNPYIIDIILFIISLVLPYKYLDNGIYSIGGIIIYIAYTLVFIMIIILTNALFRNNNKLKNKEKLPFYFTFIIFIVSTLIQILTIKVNDVSFLMTLSILAIYFTFESQDNKLLREYEIKKEEAYIANKQKEDFLSTISHEIRTPLSTIIGYSDLMLLNKNLRKKEVANNSKYIYDSANELLDLINNILDISKIESKKEVVTNTSYSLNKLVDDIKDNVLSRLKSNVEFKINIDNNMYNCFEGDYIKLYKSIVLIIQNAMCYTDFGTIVLDISETSSKEVSNLKFEITNNGSLMKKEYFNLTYDDLIKLNSKTSITNNMIGLVVSKNYIDLLGGKIEFVSINGVETKYIINIKQKRLSDVLYSNKNLNNEERIILDDKTVLIVDDNNLNIKLASKLLSNYSFNIITAESGLKCLELIKNNKIDLIFLDHMMPNMDGIETLNKMNQLGIKLPKVVALTANSDSNLKDFYLKNGFYDYLSKPINVKELDIIIKNVFRK